ncbi:hypothetical protein NQ028_07915 [Corynebacterium phoceense]|uniref:hypothetical protein n=1 Tax=Corynebacterium phoceense TaxID=1686286 RepID=UPI00211C5CFE|nr:hypothetical protein [Corynebacterium phoceense]MCQ9341064.1 hypothetical protein [Corynebacterium phoceense]
MKDEGKLKDLPEPGVKRSSHYKEGSVSYFSGRRTLLEVDLVHQEIRETEPLIGADRRPVSATSDGENLRIVTQPFDGAEELLVHSFSFESPAPDEDGKHIAKLSQLMRGGTAKDAYTIPMSIYPY